MGTVNREELACQYAGGGAGETWPPRPQQITTTLSLTTTTLPTGEGYGTKTRRTFRIRLTRGGGAGNLSGSNEGGETMGEELSLGRGTTMV